MKNRFDAGGHLTAEALHALLSDEPPDQLARLEIAEHLSFCDICLQRYTDLLAGTELLTPAGSCQEGLWQRIRARTARLFLNRYAAAAAAVALALTVVWCSSIPDPARPSLEPPPAFQTLPERRNSPRISFSGEVHEWFDSFRILPRNTQKGETAP